jgi:hypothetical protein
MLQNNRKQKSLNRRFLLILGAIAFLAFLTLGCMVLFWDKFPLDLPRYQKIAFGSVVIIYAVLRFSRLLRKEQDDEEE